MQIAKLYLLESARTVLIVVAATVSDTEIEAVVYQEFGEEVALQSRAPANDVVRALSLNEGDIYIDG